VRISSGQWHRPASDNPEQNLPFEVRIIALSVLFFPFSLFSPRIVTQDWPSIGRYRAHRDAGTITVLRVPKQMSENRARSTGVFAYS
jgi:hypothetical protein